MKTFTFFIIFSQIFTISVFGQTKIIEGQYGRNTKQVTNYVKNPGCWIDTSNITASGGSLTRNTTTPLNTTIGADCKIDASASAQTYTWALKSFDSFLKGRNCEWRFTFTGDASLYKAYIKQGTTQITPDLTLTTETNSKQVLINFPCGDLSSVTTAVIESTSSSAVSIQVTDSMVEEATNVGDANFISDWNTFTLSPQAVTTNPTKNGSPVRDTARWRRNGGDMEIEWEYAQTTGGTAGSGTYLFPLPSGYTMDTSKITQNTTGSGTMVGSGHLELNAANPPTQMGLLTTYDSTRVMLTIYATTNTIFASGTGINFGGSLSVGLYYKVPIAGWSSSRVVSMDQANYDWTSWTPIFTGFGTVTISNANDCQHKREGSNLLMRCKVTLGTTTATEARMSLPGSLVSADTTRIPTIQSAGGLVTAWNRVTANVIMALIEPSVSYITFGVQGGSNASLTKINGSTINSGDIIQINAKIPIQGWLENQNAPLLVGGVTSSSASLTRIESANISSGGVVTEITGDWINGNCSASAPYTCTFNSGIFSGTPSCTVQISQTSAYFTRIESISSSSVVYRPVDTVGPSTQNSAVNLICVGPR